MTCGNHDGFCCHGDDAAVVVAAVGIVVGVRCWCWLLLLLLLLLVVFTCGRIIDSQSRRRQDY